MARDCEYFPPSHDDELPRLKARIAELEALNHDLCERVTENNEIRLHWEEIEQTRAENERMKTCIAKLEEERRWRKFPDEKPEENVQVFVYEGRPGFRSIQTDVYTRDDGFTSTRVPRFKTYGDYVTHWMPKPSDPKEQA